MPKPPALTTQQLKERGWTPAMIRDLLGTHDRERRNEMRVGSRNRAVDAPVKLYLEERVLKAESSGQFARAQDVARVRQDSAHQAVETHKARQEAQVEAYVEAFKLDIVPPENAREMSQQELWSHHLDEYYRASLSEGLNGIRGKLRTDALNRVYAKHRAAVYAAYGWEDLL